jgi:hypothetical protein
MTRAARGRNNKNNTSQAATSSIRTPWNTQAPSSSHQLKLSNSMKKIVETKNCAGGQAEARHNSNHSLACNESDPSTSKTYLSVLQARLSTLAGVRSVIMVGATQEGTCGMRSKKYGGEALYIDRWGARRWPGSTSHVIKERSPAEAGRRSWKVSAWAEGVAGGRTALIRGADWTPVSD